MLGWEKNTKHNTQHKKTTSLLNPQRRKKEKEKKRKISTSFKATQT